MPTIETADKVPSTVKLTTFSIYRTRKTPDTTGSSIEILYGATAAELGDTKKVELKADSVPFHADSFKTKAPKPGFGLLMLYGTRDTLEEMHFWRTKAREMRAEFASAEFEFNVGDIEIGLTDRKLLNETAGVNRFLNLRRMKSTLQKDVLHRFSEYAESEGGEIKEKLNRVSQIATRPDLFDKLLESDVDLAKLDILVNPDADLPDEDLAKLDILVIPVADDPEIPGKMRQLAYVKPGTQMVSVVQSSGTATIVLPEWMKDKALAKEMREVAKLRKLAATSV